MTSGSPGVAGLRDVPVLVTGGAGFVGSHLVEGFGGCLRRMVQAARVECRIVTS